MKGVIFDFNGTLFFDNDKHIKAWGAISQKLRGKDITLFELEHQLNGVPNHQIIQYFLGGSQDLEIINRYSLLKESYYRDFCRQDVKKFHLVLGVETYFNELKEKNIPFTIASASIKENIDFFIESFHLDKWISPETIVYDDGSYENKIEMFKQAAKNIHVPIEDCLVFEDSFSGIKNAYHAGIKEIVVVCPNEKKQDYIDLPGVKKTIETFLDL